MPGSRDAAWKAEDCGPVVPERCVVVDTTDPQDKVAARIWSVIAERLDVDDGEG